MNMIAIRADGNHELGMGHIMRGLNLAHALTPGNREVEMQDFPALGVIFITKNYPQGLRKLKEAGFPVEVIALELSPENEACTVVDIAKRYNLKGIIVDKGDNGFDYIRILKEHDLSVWDFDDLGEGRFYADHVFDANLSYEDNLNLFGMDKTRRVPLFHLGPDFMVLDQVFARSGSVAGDQEIGNRRGKLEARGQQTDPGDQDNVSTLSILVSMGGSDPANLTPKVLNVLARLRGGIHITAILGPAFREIDSWTEGLGVKGNVTFVKGVSSLAPFFRDSDIAIISGGITLFEASSMGVPALVLCQNQDQVTNAIKFHDCGAAINLGLGSCLCEEALLKDVIKLTHDRELQYQMSCKGMNYVDGRGVERVTSIILNSL